MIEIVFPTSLGEWLAWLTALASILVGLYLMLMPRGFMRFIGFGDSADNDGAVSEIRGPFGGVYFGFGIAAILLAQPLIYIALGFGFLGAVIGRLLGFLVDRTFTPKILAATFLEVLGAFFPLAYAFGLIG